MKRIKIKIKNFFPVLKTKMANFFAKELNDSNRLIVFVEGNIGSGKTTLLDSLEELNYKVFREFRDLFAAEYNVDDEEKNIVELFYINKKKYAFPLQVSALNSRTALIKSAVEYLEYSKEEREIVFIERSILTDLLIFAPTLHEDGDIDHPSFCIYQDLAANTMDVMDALLQHYRKIFLYLDAPVEVCLQRIAERGREGEDKITQEYLTKLQAKHDNWLKAVDGPETFVLDASKSTDKILWDVLELLPGYQDRNA